MPTVVIALGSNLGPREEHLAHAVRLLASEMKVEKLSSLYETAPMYVEDQPAFLNAVLIAKTSDSPRALLKRLKWVESEVGRLARARYGPREVDVDLIAYGSLIYRWNDSDAPSLQVPHALLQERRFVLEPLAEIEPNFALPGLPPLQEMLKKTIGQADCVVKKGELLFSRVIETGRD